MQFWGLVEIDRKVGLQPFIFITFVSKEFISRRMLYNISHCARGQGQRRARELRAAAGHRAEEPDPPPHAEAQHAMDL